MSKKNQVYEIAEALKGYSLENRLDRECVARMLYEKGYRMQIQAEWVYNEFYFAHCSECGYEVPEHSVSSYCPGCGAYMEAE